MNIDTTLFLLTSLLVVGDFGFSGLFLFRVSKAAKPPERPFIAGIAWLLLTVAAFNLFWIILITVGPSLQLSDNPIRQHIATAFIVGIDIAAVVGRWRWWRRIIVPAVTNGHHQNEEVPPDENKNA